MSTIISNVKGHGALQQHSAGPAFSSNHNFKKRISPLEVLSEATADEADVESLSEACSGSACTSPTFTRESSSDENANLLVRKFGSSQYPVEYGHEAKQKRHDSMHVQQSLTNKPDKSRVKVSFQGEVGSSAATEISSTRLYKHLQLSNVTDTVPSSANRTGIDFFTAHKAPETSQPAPSRRLRSDTDMQLPESAIKLGSCHRCFPVVSGRVTDLLRKSSNSLCKLQGLIIGRLRRRSLESEDEGDSIQGHLSDTNMDDVNEMKALLNTINHNLKLLETRSKAHPQLLSSKLAPVYFTT